VFLGLKLGVIYLRWATYSLFFCNLFFFFIVVIKKSSIFELWIRYQRNWNLVELFM